MPGWSELPLKPGVLLFLRLGGAGIHHAIEEVTAHQWKSELRMSHVGVVLKENPVQILEARESVRLVDPEKFFLDFEGRPIHKRDVWMGRFRISNQERETWLKALKDMSGIEYANDFLPGSEKTYCADLIASTLNSTLKREAIAYRPMEFGEKGSSVRKIWEDYFREKSFSIPEGFPGVSPQSIFNSELFERLV